MQTVEVTPFNQEYQSLEVWKHSIDPKISHRIISSYLPPENNVFRSKSLGNSLNDIFPQPTEETKLQKAKRVLGEVVKDQTDEQLQTFITEAQYLIDSWLDDYERQLFDGLTLKQVLKGTSK